MVLKFDGNSEANLPMLRIELMGIEYSGAAEIGANYRRAVFRILGEISELPMRVSSGCISNSQAPKPFKTENQEWMR